MRSNTGRTVSMPGHLEATASASSWVHRYCGFPMAMPAIMGYTRSSSLELRTDRSTDFFCFGKGCIQIQNRQNHREERRRAATAVGEETLHCYRDCRTDRLILYDMILFSNRRHRNESKRKARKNNKTRGQNSTPYVAGLRSISTCSGQERRET